MLKIKWTDRISNDEFYKRTKGEILLSKVLKYKRHSWIWHIIRHSEFVVNILERAITGKKAVGVPRLQYSFWMIITASYSHFIWSNILRCTQYTETYNVCHNAMTPTAYSAQIIHIY
jgi:hypothetical protein